MSRPERDGAPTSTEVARAHAMVGSDERRARVAWSRVLELRRERVRALGVLALHLGQRLGEDNWTRAELYLRRRGGPAIFLSRFLPVLHSLVPLTVGMSGFSYRRFMAWTTPACTVWAIAYVGVGAAANYRTRLRQPEHAKAREPSRHAPTA